MKSSNKFSAAHWRLARGLRHQQIPAYLRDWVLDPGSTTRRIYQAFGVAQKIRMIQQGWCAPHPSEAGLLNLPLRRRALIREVELSCQDQVWMVARTVFPAQTLKGKQGSRLAYYLDERPLGSLLFREPTTQRSEFELAVLQPQHFEYQWAIRSQPEHDLLWARRSIIWFDHKPLLLTEVFLPDLLKRA
jgi:chorismate--pyruvate lyase